MGKDRLQTLEISMAEFKRDIDYLKKGADKNDEQHEQILKKIEESSVKIDGFIQSAEDRFAAKKDHRESMKQMGDVIATMDSKFAPRIVYTVMCWLGGIIGTAIVLGVIGVIANAYLHFGNL